MVGTGTVVAVTCGFSAIQNQKQSDLFRGEDRRPEKARPPAEKGRMFRPSIQAAATPSRVGSNVASTGWVVAWSQPHRRGGHLVRGTRAYRYPEGARAASGHLLEEELRAAWQQFPETPSIPTANQVLK